MVASGQPVMSSLLRPERVDVTSDRVHLVSQRQDPDASDCPPRHASGLGFRCLRKAMTFDEDCASSAARPSVRTPPATTPHPRDRPDHDPSQTPTTAGPPERRTRSRKLLDLDNQILAGQVHLFLIFRRISRSPLNTRGWCCRASIRFRISWTSPISVASTEPAPRRRHRWPPRSSR